MQRPNFTVDATKSLIKFSILGINKTLILIDNDLHSCKLLYYKLILCLCVVSGSSHDT